MVAGVGGRAETILTPTPAELLDFEAAHAGGRGDLEGEIRRTLGIPPARYFQLLMRATATHEGQAHDAITAHRVLRRVRN